MSTFDPSTNHLNDNAVADAAADRQEAPVGRHAGPLAEADEATERNDANLSTLDEASHPFDQTNGIVEAVDRHNGVEHTNDEQLDADPGDEEPVVDDEPGRESPSHRGPIVNTALITEEVFGDDETRKPRFD